MEEKEPIQEALLADAQHGCMGHDKRCPLCERDNECRVAEGHLYKGPCWCREIIVPQDILKRLAEAFLAPACFCRPCLETIAQIACESNDTETILVKIRNAVAANRLEQSPEIEPDYYLDEFGNTVFTAVYHLKRGTCCDNQCRHCPY